MRIFRLFATQISIICVAILTLPDTAYSRTLVLGSVSSNVKKHLTRFSPLAAYLEKELASQGIDRVEARVLPNSASMSKALKEGKIDVYFDSPLVAARVARLSGSKPFLRRWKSGVGEYHSVIVVPANSSVERLSELNGEIIGFQDRDSTSGFLLPMSMFNDAGLIARELRSHRGSVSESEIGYVFTGDDQNSLLWLDRGWIGAIATDPQNFELLDRAKPGEFRVVARSVNVPRQVVIGRDGLETELKDALADIMVVMHQTEAGSDVLMKFNKTQKFDEFPDSIEATFEPIYEVLDELDRLGLL